MTQKRNTRTHLVAVRLSDTEYETLVRCAASGKVPVAVLSYIRDLIRSADSPMHEREILVSVRKMQTDLSFCLGLLKSGKASEETVLLAGILADIDKRLKELQKGGGSWRSQNSHI